VAEGALKEGGETHLALLGPVEEDKEGDDISAQTMRHRRQHRAEGEESDLQPVRGTPLTFGRSSYGSRAAHGNFKVPPAGGGGDIESGGGQHPHPPSGVRPGDMGRRSSYSALPAYPSNMSSLLGLGLVGTSSGADLPRVSATGVTVGGEGPQKEASWLVRGVALTHKYTGPVHVDLTINNAGEGGSCWPGMLLLVCVLTAACALCWDVVQCNALGCPTALHPSPHCLLSRLSVHEAAAAPAPALRCWAHAPPPPHPAPVTQGAVTTRGAPQRQAVSLTQPEDP
jgi:hypothetical protein